MKVIGPLTDPTAHGGQASDAFDVVIPSLPGHGFSGKPTAPGWTVEHVAQAWATLMQRPGYSARYADGHAGGAIGCAAGTCRSVVVHCCT
jgi:pimeloyl-ACP methyl ester carboxylesterase